MKGKLEDMNLGAWLALLLTLLVVCGSVSALALFVRWFQRVSRIPIGHHPPRSAAPGSPRPADELDREVFARVQAPQAAGPRPAVTPPRPAALQDRNRSSWTKGQEQTNRLHQPVRALRTDVPDHLPVKVKGYFFSRSEQAFFQVLEEALPPGYRVFPNVRLNDLFLITAAPHQRHGTYARLRDKHVDFLVVSLPGHCPVFAIELDGMSHDTATQQRRDAVKDTAFRSAGLPLLRLRAEEQHTQQSLGMTLKRHLQDIQTVRRTLA